MDVAARSRKRVRERLARLEQEFGPVAVDQTTFPVEPAAYERAVERSREGQVVVHASVHNGSGDVLLSEADGRWAIPRGRTQPTERPADAAERIVRETAGLDCTVRDVDRATIYGVRNGDDAGAETVYRLSVVFDAEVDGAVVEAAPGAPHTAGTGDAASGVMDPESVRWESRRDAAVAEFV